jgi:hypothetical protein
MIAPDDDRRGDDAVGREDGRSAARGVGDEQPDIRLARRLDAGMDSSGRKSAG